MTIRQSFDHRWTGERTENGAKNSSWFHTRETIASFLLTAISDELDILQVLPQADTLTASDGGRSLCGLTISFSAATQLFEYGICKAFSIEYSRMRHFGGCIIIAYKP